MPLARAKDSMCRLDIYNQHDVKDSKQSDKLAEQLVDEGLQPGMLALAHPSEDSDDDALAFDLNDSEDDHSDSEEDSDSDEYSECSSPTKSEQSVQDCMEDRLVHDNQNENRVTPPIADNAMTVTNTSDSLQSKLSLNDQKKSHNKVPQISPHSTLPSPQYGTYSYEYAGPDDMYDDYYYASYDEEDAEDVFCCFTPWNQREKDKLIDDNDDLDKVDGEMSTHSSSEPVMSDVGSCSEDSSIESEEKTNTGHKDKIFIEMIDTQKPLKGILKTSKTFCRESDGSVDIEINSKTKKRRSLFPNAPNIIDTYSPSGSQRTRIQKRVNWSSMARVTNIECRNSFTIDEKCAYWWQRNDFEDFKRAGRIITRAMMVGGQEIWLSNSNSVKNANFTKDDDDYGDSWWCKFGHSRRGLEHVTDIEQGRRRQKNVQQAIHSVVNEQRKQRIMNREDADKLAMVMNAYTR